MGNCKKTISLLLALAMVHDHADEERLDPISVTYSAKQYYNAVMQMDDGDASGYSVSALKAVMKAMYQYYLSAGIALN